jgi:hypothetical protein
MHLLCAPLGQDAVNGAVRAAECRTLLAQLDVAQGAGAAQP